MIKTLRRKFITLTMISVVIVLTFIMGAINIANFHSTDEDANERLVLLEMNGGSFSDFKVKNPPQKPGNESQSSSADSTAGSSISGGGKKQGQMSAETPFDTRYFTVTFSDEKTVKSVDTSNIAAISSKKAVTLAKTVYKKSKKEGYIGAYKYKQAKKYK